MTVSQRTAKWILTLACLVFALCIAQRSLNVTKVNATLTTAVVQSQQVDKADASAEKICSLSAKSLSSVPPIVDIALPFLILLLALSGDVARRVSWLAFDRTSYPPLRRLHLTHCVFRE